MAVAWHGTAEISKSMRLSDNIVCRFRRNPAGFFGKRGKGKSTEEREARANRRREMVTFIKAKLCFVLLVYVCLCDVLSPDYAHEQPLLFLLWINTGCTKWCAKLVKKDPGRARQSR